MAGMPNGLGPGLNIGGMRVCDENSPRKSSGSPVSQVSKMARSASISSRMRAIGRSKEAPYRFSTWARTCDPRPREKRPPDSS